MSRARVDVPEIKFPEGICDDQVSRQTQEYLSNFKGYSITPRTLRSVEFYDDRHIFKEEYFFNKARVFRFGINAREVDL